MLKPLQLRKLGNDLRAFMSLCTSGAALDHDCGQLCCVHKLRTAHAIVPAFVARVSSRPFEFEGPS
jgi:hypothetical protein